MGNNVGEVFRITKTYRGFIVVLHIYTNLMVLAVSRKLFCNTGWESEDRKPTEGCYLTILDPQKVCRYKRPVESR